VPGKCGKFGGCQASICLLLARWFLGIPTYSSVFSFFPPLCRYLFGVGQGTAVVLLSATIAATVAFFIGKTLLRTWVEEMLQDQPQFAKIDKAVGREGFKLLLLVRLSPIFPFALSNYLYGASSIDFVSYFWGTLFGFAPGTLAYVYTGMIGKELTLGGGEGSQPWFVYAGGLALLAGFLKLVSDVASEIVNAIDDDDDEDAAALPNTAVNEDDKPMQFPPVLQSLFSENK